MADYPPGALTAAAESLAVHRWKSMGVASAECECGAILHGDADPFPADEAFRAHLASEILQAATPHLLAAEVSAHRAEQDTTLSRVRSLLDAAILISGERYVRADYVREALEGDSDE